MTGSFPVNDGEEVLASLPDGTYEFSISWQATGIGNIVVYRNASIVETFLISSGTGTSVTTAIIVAGDSITIVVDN